MFDAALDNLSVVETYKLAFIGRGLARTNSFHRANVIIGDFSVTKISTPGLSLSLKLASDSKLRTQVFLLDSPLPFAICYAQLIRLHRWIRSLLCCCFIAGFRRCQFSVDEDCEKLGGSYRKISKVRGQIIRLHLTPVSVLSYLMPIRFRLGLPEGHISIRLQQPGLEPIQPGLFALGPDNHQRASEICGVKARECSGLNITKEFIG